VLVQAMKDSEVAGISKFVMRDRQHLGALRIREGVIVDAMDDEDEEEDGDDDGEKGRPSSAVVLGRRRPS
jgi:hypothetical protein